MPKREERDRSFKDQLGNWPKCYATAHGYDVDITYSSAVVRKNAKWQALWATLACIVVLHFVPIPLDYYGWPDRYVPYLYMVDYFGYGDWVRWALILSPILVFYVAVYLWARFSSTVDALVSFRRGGILVRSHSHWFAKRIKAGETREFTAMPHHKAQDEHRKNQSLLRKLPRGGAEPPPIYQTASCVWINSGQHRQFPVLVIEIADDENLHQAGIVAAALRIVDQEATALHERYMRRMQEDQAAAATGRLTEFD